MSAIFPEPAELGTPLTDAIERSATNPCRLCAPLGACLVFKGTAGGITLLHGSQGCATYIRRYLISHFREPVDIASSSFSEDSVVFGGGANLKRAIDNIIAQYHPALIGIATTCLSETIGDDVDFHLASMEPAGPAWPSLVAVSTASYRGCHTDGYRAAVVGLLTALVHAAPPSGEIALVPGLLSPADIRYVKELLADMAVKHTVVADYSESLDGGVWDVYEPMPAGGTPLAKIRGLGGAAAIFDWSGQSRHTIDGGTFLNEKFAVPAVRTPPPIGVEATDAWIASVSACRKSQATGRPRGRAVAAHRCLH